MTIESNITEWLHQRPNWQQEVAERVLSKGVLSPNDIEEIITLLKSKTGQEKSNSRIFQGLEHKVTTTSELRLLSIGSIEGIDNLAPRKPLKFGEKNLTVIYGSNGSGKSGYARILKKICGKKQPDLRSNVFSNKLPDKQGCEISYKISDKNETVEWSVKDGTISDLNGVDVFDSGNGSLYLTSENETSYTPEIMIFFKNLIHAFESVKEQLENEKKMLVSILPALPNQYVGTKASATYNYINPLKDIKYYDGITNWTDDDEKNLKEINERLNVADPKLKATNIQETIRQINRIRSSLSTTIKKLSPIEISKINALKTDAKNKRKAAIEGVNVLKESSNLQGVGAETWRALWMAARIFSEKEAYKNSEYPKVDDNAHCVLCHQELSPDAQIRLKKFEEYVSGTLSINASEAESALKRSLDALPEINTADTVTTSIKAADLDSEIWQPRINQFWIDINQYVDRIKQVDTTDFKGINEEQYDWFKELDIEKSNLDKIKKQYEKDIESFDRSKAEVIRKELTARKWTSEQKSAIEAEYSRLQKVFQIDRWIKTTVTTSISKQAGRISEEVISKAYVQRFNSELEKLGAKHLRVELVKTRALKGQALHRLTLKGLNVKSNPPIEILSEGERRIVMLASFIADVRGNSQSTPFIFDDPISSLDQDYEEKTIDRLIELSNERQVIIFTHRLSFLGILEGKSSPDIVCLRQESWGTGEPGDVPIFGKKPESALKNLKNDRLSKANKIYRENGHEAYYPLAKAICSDFRIIIERIVEFVFLADVIQRHRREVNTKGKIDNLLRIKKSDCEMIDKMMSKYSRFEHSQTFEAPVEVPAPKELEVDIDNLLSWHSEFIKRVVK